MKKSRKTKEARKADKKQRQPPALSPSRVEYLKRCKRDKTVVALSRIFILVLFIAFWEAAAELKIIDAFMFSSPSRILSTLDSLQKSGELFTHVFTTLYETVVGFLIATAVGCAVSVALWWSENLRKILEPYIVVLNALPKIALGPVIIIAFGAGTGAIIFMTFLVTVIVTVINMLSGFMQTDSGKILLLRSMGAKKRDILFNLVLPGSHSVFVSALKVNVGLSWIGSIMGEYVVSRQGIGYLIVYGGQVLKLDLVMTGTVLLCLLAAAMYALVLLYERLTAKGKK